MNLDIRCTTCGVSLNTTNIQQKFCTPCRKARDKESQRRSKARRKAEGYKMPPKPKRVRDGECKTCDLEIGCRAQLRQNLDPLCWSGPETSNEYYHLYEKAIGKKRESIPDSSASIGS